MVEMNSSVWDNSRIVWLGKKIAAVKMRRKTVPDPSQMNQTSQQLHGTCSRNNQDLTKQDASSATLHQSWTADHVLRKDSHNAEGELEDFCWKLGGGHLGESCGMNFILCFHG